jgi:hypothetical protein
MYYRALKGGAMGRILTSTEIGRKLRAMRQRSGLTTPEAVARVNEKLKYHGNRLAGTGNR